MLYAVIMAGGTGERFWPASRKKRPKQLLQFFGNKTLLESTVERILPLIGHKNIIVVTNSEQADSVRQVLPEIPSKNVIAEPVGRNTAPCIGLAARFIQSCDPTGVMVVLPADHIISQEEKFLQNIADAAAVADESKRLITFGIKPAGPETGYGYIQADERQKYGKKTSFCSIKGFYEKPDHDTALNYFESGTYFWNSGMFVWRVDCILEALKRYLPKMYATLEKTDLSFEKGIDMTSLKKAYDSIEGISIDYGVMEKSKKVLVASADFVWDDVGSWTALERHCKKDSKGNVVSGDVLSIDTKQCIINADKRIIATVGLKDIIIVDTEDALLICNKDAVQDVKKVVTELKKKDIYERYL